MIPGSTLSAPPSGGTIRPAKDADHPAVTRDGSASFALVALVQERIGGSARAPCGGALVGVVPGAGDPRSRWDALSFVQTETLVDERGYGWLTDVYADRDDATRKVWVQNVGGARGWTPDDGRSHCAPLQHGDRSYNVMLHADGPEEIELFFSPASRSPEPIASGPSPS